MKSRFSSKHIQTFPPMQKPVPEDWAEFTERIKLSTPVDALETEEDIKERLQLFEADPEAAFKYYFPDYCFSDPAAFHIEATQRIIQHPEWYEVRLWSRDLAKSTRTMMEILYLCLLGKKKYVLMISNSLDNATRLLQPYRANLQVNGRIIKDYGPQMKAGHWKAEEFTTLKGVTFRALGAGQSPRGTRNAAARPDVLLFDDIDTDAQCRNPRIINDKWHWIEEAAIGTRSVSAPTLIIFCGNRIAVGCCVDRATLHADHVTQVNIRNEEGTSTWPQKNSEEVIDRVLKQKSLAAIQKEYYNNPLTEGAVFSQMAWKPALPLEEYSMLVCYTDPSFKDSKDNDFKATVLVGRWQDEYHVIKCYLEQTSTAQMVKWHYAMMQLVGRNACHYFMEEVFMQDTLMQAFHEAGKQPGNKVIPIQGDKRRKIDKFTRIETLLEPLHANGKLYLNAHEKYNPHMVRLAEQFMALAPGSSAHDDGPDAVEGAIWKINNKEMVKNTVHFVTPNQGNSKGKIY